MQGHPDDPNLSPEQKMANALRVLILDPRTQMYLIEHDPKALQQARDAVRAYELQEKWSL